MDPNTVPHRPSPATASADSPSPERAQSSGALLAGHWVVFGLSFIFPAIAVQVVPVFEDVFRSFGAELPWPTLALLKYRLALLAVPVLALVPALWASASPPIERAAHRRSKLFLLAWGLLLCAGLAAVVWAMYLPIFRVGTVV